MSSPSIIIIIIIIVIALFVSPSFSAYLAPVTKHHDHHSNNKPYYTISVYLKTPPQPTNLLLDLGATYTSIDCTRNYTSTTSHFLPCNSSICLSHSHSHPFSLSTTNCDIRPPRHTVVYGAACVGLPRNSYPMVDLLALPTTDGRNPGRLGFVHDYAFSCSNASHFLRGKGVTGFAGMGLSRFSLPAQVSTNSSALGLFALCLSGSPSAPGVAFFDHPGPYYFWPGIDVSNSLNYTPILSHRTTVKRYGYGYGYGYAQRSADEYFIGVTSIEINGKRVTLNRRLLDVNQKGYGGTRISTVDPYAVLERSIFEAFTEAFANESAAMSLTPTDPIKPFSLCYQADGLQETDVGPSVPIVDLVMQSDDVFWRIYGRNSMVRIVREGLDVWCLGFLDGGRRPTASVVIGGHQIEDNLLQFDLGRKRLGFSSPLFVDKAMCANFNFTTNNSI